jgi:hypothetical protein
VTIDLLLVARGARDSLDAALIVRTLRLDRSAHGRGDAYALRTWRVIIPLLAAHGGNSMEFLAAARAAGIGHVVMNALEIPLAAMESTETTSRLVEIFNLGHGTTYRHPALRAAVTP